VLAADFFNRESTVVAPKLLGCVLHVKYDTTWLTARIIETEAYCLDDKASHASLGFTQKRRALFMPAGTIYMYYARGGDSLNISCAGEGNAVLIKSAYPEPCTGQQIPLMQALNPINGRVRTVDTLCAGQTLLCRCLHLKVPQWDQQQFCADRFYISPPVTPPSQYVQTTRLGIPSGRDGHLLYRFIDIGYAKQCSRNPLTQRNLLLGRDYLIKGAWQDDLNEPPA
jgi:DNA-3-methyladenine glycosylase